MGRVLMERNIECTLRDGVVLRADVFRPDDDDPHPALLQRTPYDKTFISSFSIDPFRMAEAGYTVVVQDVRGRFASDGVFEPYRHEGEDGYDTVQWVAEQPWCDGQVGMCGISYLAQVQLQAAALRPPALRAIAPMESPSGSTGGDRVRAGALALGVLSYWGVSMAPAEILRRGRKQPELRKEFPAAIDDIDNLDQHVRRLPLVPFPPIDERAGGISPQFDQTVRGEFNQPMPRFRHSDVEVPAFVIAGWYDLFLQPDLEHFTALRESARTEEARRLTRLLVAPWSHGRADHTVGELDFGFRSGPLMIDLREDLNDLQRRWFDARLRGVNRGLDDEPRVRLFVMGINRWRDEEEWPLRRAREQQWHLHRDYRGEAPLQGHLMPASGGLDLTPPQEAEPSVFWLEPDDPVPTRGGAILMSPWYIKGPVDQLRTECRDDVLLFTSEPLRQPLEVTGRVKLVCWVAAETVDTDVVARLCDVHPDGRSFNLMDGVLRLGYRNGTPQAERLNPGEVVRVEVDLWSTAHVFLPGHRLRLQVCASDFPRYDRNPGTGETSAIATRVLPQRNRLFHDPERPSHLLLPVVPA